MRIRAMRPDITRKSSYLEREREREREIERERERSPANKYRRFQQLKRPTQQSSASSLRSIARVCGVYRTERLPQLPQVSTRQNPCVALFSNGPICSLISTMNDWSFSSTMNDRIILAENNLQHTDPYSSIDGRCVQRRLESKRAGRRSIRARTGCNLCPIDWRERPQSPQHLLFHLRRDDLLHCGQVG